MVESTHTIPQRAEAFTYLLCQNDKAMAAFDGRMAAQLACVHCESDPFKPEDVRWQVRRVPLNPNTMVGNGDAPVSLDASEKSTPPAAAPIAMLEAWALQFLCEDGTPSGHIAYYPSETSARHYRDNMLRNGLVMPRLIKMVSEPA